MDKWFEKRDEGGLVLASRVDFVRNLKQYPFSPRLTGEQAKQLCTEIRTRSAKLEELDEKKYYSCSLNRLSETEKDSLCEWAIISAEIARKPQETALILSEDEGVNILVNEENHIKIQAKKAGENLKDAFDTAKSVEEVFAEAEYACEEKYGYLTTSPYDAGTGMRAAFLMFLPGIVLMEKQNKLSEILATFPKIRPVTEPFFEGTDHSGPYLFHLMNSVTMGITNQEILDDLSAAAQRVKALERTCREELAATRFKEIEDKVYRSYGVLKYTKQITAKDAILLLAQLKLGNELAMLPMKKSFRFLEQMVRIQPANMKKACGKNISENECMIVRADYLNRLILQSTENGL